jgi:hypothetical protein
MGLEDNGRTRGHRGAEFVRNQVKRIVERRERRDETDGPVLVPPQSSGPAHGLIHGQHLATNALGFLCAEFEGFDASDSFHARFANGLYALRRDQLRERLLLGGDSSRTGLENPYALIGRQVDPAGRPGSGVKRRF